MTTRIQDTPYELQPAEYPVCYIGDTLTYQAQTFDGERRGGLPHGAPVDVSDPNVTGHLRINAPDGTSDLDVQHSAKVDHDGDGTVEAFRWTVADTGTWVEQDAGMSVEFRNSAGSVVRTTQVGKILIRPKPIAAAP